MDADEIAELRERIKFLEDIVCGEKCEDCRQFSVLWKKCDGCDIKFCKCNSFYRPDDCYTFCSRKCLEKNFNYACEEKTCYPAGRDYIEKIMSEYEGR